MMILTNVIIIDNDDGDCQYCAYDDGDYVRVIIFLLIMLMIWRSALSLWRCWWCRCWWWRRSWLLSKWRWWHYTMTEGDYGWWWISDNFERKTFTLYWDKTMKLVSRYTSNKLVFVSDLYSPRIGLHISSSIIGRPTVGIYKSPIDAWMWKLGMRHRYSFSGNICFEISVFCLCSACRNAVVVQAATLWVESEGWTNMEFGWTGCTMYFESMYSVEI